MGLSQKEFKGGTIRYPLSRALLATCTPEQVEPTCYTQAVKFLAWREAMNSEFDALMRNGIWTLVPPPSRNSIVGCKWVFRIKHKPDGSIERHQARLVAKGFHQQQGLDYDETFSSVIKPTTIRLILSYAVTCNWVIKQINISNAFLHGFLSETVYMQQPPSFVHPHFPHHVCKLRKALYGLKQAPRARFSRLSSKLLALGFINSRADTSLFIRRQACTCIFVLIYVDDIIITGSNISLVHDFIASLDIDFAVKDLGDIHYFLGIEIIRDANSMFLAQQRYTTNLLDHTGMLTAKPIASPMSSSVRNTCLHGWTSLFGPNSLSKHRMCT